MSQSLIGSFFNSAVCISRLFYAFELHVFFLFLFSFRLVSKWYHLCSSRCVLPRFFLTFLDHSSWSCYWLLVHVTSVMLFWLVSLSTSPKAGSWSYSTSIRIHCIFYPFIIFYQPITSTLFAFHSREPPIIGSPSGFTRYFFILFISSSSDHEWIEGGHQPVTEFWHGFEENRLHSAMPHSLSIF